MSATRRALLEWMATEYMRNDDGECCMRSHAPKQGEGYYPDESVCLREQKWRAYVRLRDGNPHFPFTQTPWHQTFGRTYTNDRCMKEDDVIEGAQKLAAVIEIRNRAFKD